jgi:putative transposase
MRSSKASNGRLRDECLNVHQFVSLADARAKIEASRLEYNQHRPQSFLGNLTRWSFSASVQETRIAEIGATL